VSAPHDVGMVAVLLTGMSGTGKTTALAGLARRGFETIDTDDAGWIEAVGGEPLWRRDRIDAALNRPRNGPLVVVGTVANQSEWSDRFAAVVLFTAPVEVLVRRLRERPPGEFGTTQADRAKVARDAAEVEPLLRAMATHVLDASADPGTVMANLVQIIDSTQ
jgi:dephospho-CoA kinase